MRAIFAATTTFFVMLIVESAISQTTMPLKIVEQSAAPVVLSGTVALAAHQEQQSSSYRTMLSAANVSGKPILLLITSIYLAERPGEDEEASADENYPFITYHHTDDYFFSPHLFDPASTIRWEDSLVYSRPSNHGSELPTTKVTATGEVSFVQFVDGSTWGDPKSAEKSLRERTDSCKLLRLLLKAYQENGAREFVAMLNQGPGLPVRTKLQYRFKESNGKVQAVIDELTRMLQSVELHENSTRLPAE